MTKLLNLTIKINNTANYKNDTSATNYRIIEPISLSIKDQNGRSVSELKTHIKSSNIGRGKLPVSNIRKIKISSSPSLDIPISWSWENRVGGKIEFILKIKYDEQKGFWDGGLGIGADTLFLGQDDFEVETFESRGEKFFHSWQIFEVEANKYAVPTFHEFSDLYWKIIKAGEDEQIAPNCPLDIEVRRWKTANPIINEEGEFYELRSINGNVEEAKKISEDFLREVIDLNSIWKTKGIKTLLAAQVAKKNGFDIITDTGLRSQITNGKYQGFSIADGEKHQCLSNDSIHSAFFTGLFSVFVDFSTMKNRFTKENIDTFRKLFPHDQSQTDPKYFYGFRPGEIYLNNGTFWSYNHRQDFKDKKTGFFEIEIDQGYTRTYYEFWSCKESANHQAEQTIREIIFRPEAFSELNKTKKEHWDIYWEWLNKFWHPIYAKKVFGNLHQQLTELLPLLDKPSFANQSQTDLEVALKVLKNYDNPAAGSDQEAIKNKFSTEIKAKKAEITSLIKKPLEEDIDAAANENYGLGLLNSERKRIFTTLRDQIGTSTLLTEIKNLIRLLIKGEKLIPGPNWLEKKILSNQLKKEYQTGSGDKKAAYGIVNQVDNQWVDRIITELEKFTKKETQNFLAECRTQLLTKYDNSTMAQAVFGNNFLDSVAALEEADKLLVKAREAETKNDTDTSLLKFLQNYQKAREGTLKNKAWQAVNSYNGQVEAAIKHLQKNYQSREELTKAIQNAENESKLEEVYNQVQNNDLYQQGDKSKMVIDNLVQRKEILFQIEKSANISSCNKTLLQIILTKVPDTINDDDEEEELTWLENQLKSFKIVSESEEKGKIYQEYKTVIDQVLTEISQEKQRYQQTKQQDHESVGGNDKNKNPSKTLPEWAWLFIIMGVIAAIASIIWIISRNSRKRIKRSIKLK